MSLDVTDLEARADRYKSAPRVDFHADDNHATIEIISPGITEMIGYGWRDRSPIDGDGYVVHRNREYFLVHRGHSDALYALVDAIGANKALVGALPAFRTLGNVRANEVLKHIPVYSPVFQRDKGSIMLALQLVVDALAGAPLDKPFESVPAVKKSEK